MKNFKSVACAVVSTFTLFLAPLMAQAMGISPVLFEANNLLDNSSVARTIYLTRGNPDADEKGTVRVDGPAAKYIRLPDNGIVALPKGVYNTPYQFFIEPGTLGAGDYEAAIKVAPYVPPRGPNDAGGSGVIAGAQAKILFSVTTTASELYEIHNPMINSTEEGQVLDFTFQFANMGNVDTRPTQIEVHIVDTKDPTFSYEEYISAADLKIIKALTTEVYDVPTKAKLNAGSYAMVLEFYKGDQPFLKSPDLQFQVYPRGTLAQKGDLSSFAINKTAFDNGEIALFKSAFKNSGKVGLTATLTINIARGNQIVDMLSTDPTFVPMGQTVLFDKTYRPQDAGSYTATAYVGFGPYRTREISVNFTVGSKLSLAFVLPTLCGFLILVFIILWLIVRRKNKKNVLPVQPVDMPSAVIVQPENPPAGNNPQPPVVGS